MENSSPITHQRAASNYPPADSQVLQTLIMTNARPMVSQMMFIMVIFHQQD